MSQLIIVKYVRKEGSYSTVDIVLDKDITNLGIVLPNDLAKRFTVVSGVKGTFHAEIDSAEQDWLTILKGLRLMRWHTITSHVLLNPNSLEETRFYMEREVGRSVAFSPRTNNTTTSSEQDGSHHGEDSGNGHAHAPPTQLLQRPALRPFNSYHVEGMQQRVAFASNDSSANPVAAMSTGVGVGSSGSSAVPVSNPTASNNITSSASSSSTVPSTTTNFEFNPRPHYSSGLVARIRPAAPSGAPPADVAQSAQSDPQNLPSTQPPSFHALPTRTNLLVNQSTFSRRLDAPVEESVPKPSSTTNQPTNHQPTNYSAVSSAEQSTQQTVAASVASSLAAIPSVASIVGGTAPRQPFSRAYSTQQFSSPPNNRPVSPVISSSEQIVPPAEVSVSSNSTAPTATAPPTSSAQQESTTAATESSAKANDNRSMVSKLLGKYNRKSNSANSVRSLSQSSAPILAAEGDESRSSDPKSGSSHIMGSPDGNAGGNSVGNADLMFTPKAISISHPESTPRTPPPTENVYATPSSAYSATSAYENSLLESRHNEDHHDLPSSGDRRPSEDDGHVHFSKADLMKGRYTVFQKDNSDQHEVNKTAHFSKLGSAFLNENSFHSLMGAGRGRGLGGGRFAGRGRGFSPSP
eukprot:gene5327-5862_t